MNSEQIAQKMIIYSNGNLHDINHFMKVYAFAKTIGKCENLDDKQQLILEISAIIHDIACPLCRIKYGNTDGKYQEKEGYILAKKFLFDNNLNEDIIDRVAFLVGHHHTVDKVDGIDYQILLESDYLVNADESSFSQDNIEHAFSYIFKTATGKNILKNMYMTD